MSWNEQPDEFLMCRDTGIRHSWEPYDAQHEGKYILERLRCVRCEAIKSRRLSPTTGRIVGQTQFAYPEGYVRHGQGRLSKADNAEIRLESLHRRYEL